MNGGGGGFKHNSEQRQRPMAQLPLNWDKPYPERGSRKRCTHTPKKTGLMDRLWRLHLTLCYDNHSVLLTFWHVKGPGSAEAKTQVLGGVARQGRRVHFCVGDRGGPNTWDNTLRAPLVRWGRKPTLSKELFGCQTKQRRHQHKRPSGSHLIGPDCASKQPHYRLGQDAGSVIRELNPKASAIEGGQLRAFL